MLRTLAVLLLVGYSWPACSATAQEEIGVPRGSVAPAVTLDDLDGQPVDLGEYLGRKPVLLEFWALWCENCAALAPRMDAAHERYGDRVAFFAVAVGVGQNPRSIRRHLQRHPVPFPVLWDEQGAGVRAFMTPTTSYIVIVDQAGKVVYTGVGPSQDIEAAIQAAIE
jgi:thiol-disulfide isomerase/thioredoxin